MTTTGITASNYFIEVERIGVETLPETLKKGHDLVVKSTPMEQIGRTIKAVKALRK
jgi:prephenate dehydrogenase